MSKPLSEMTLQELWELFPIQVTEYKEHWKDWYREERAFLSYFLPLNSVTIIKYIIAFGQILQSNYLSARGVPGSQQER